MLYPGQTHIYNTNISFSLEKILKTEEQKILLHSCHYENCLEHKFAWFL